MIDRSHWKRRIAKEWLIFLCVVALASIAYFINQNIISQSKRQSADRLIQQYKDMLNEYNKILDPILKDKLIDWNPKKPKLDKDEYVYFSDERQCPLSPNRLYLAERIKLLFPYFADWDELEIRACLGHIDVCGLPDKPYNPTLQMHHGSYQEEPFNFTDYLTFVLIPYAFAILTRSVWWSIKKVRK